jgi:O-methyltransferase domain
MTGFSRRVNASVAEAHDFSRYGLIVDVGGGHGALLAGILAHHPGVRGVLFDQPAVVAGADADGFQIVGGSFFESVPEGGDAYLLKSILHDWEDEPAVDIVRACRRAARAATALLLIERQFATVPLAPPGSGAWRHHGRPTPLERSVVRRPRERVRTRGGRRLHPPHTRIARGSNRKRPAGHWWTGRQWRATSAGTRPR